LLAEGVPAGADLPMIVLSGCSTGLAARQERLHRDTGETAPTAVQPGTGGQRLKQESGEGEGVLASFAAELVGAGVPLVLAMQAPVTDAYATALGGEFYRRLATDDPRIQPGGVGFRHPQCRRYREADKNLPSHLSHGVLLLSRI
jgi:CHAT domain